jgi:general stress protein 26
MKILWKEVRNNILTLGYTGTRKSSGKIKEIEKNRKVALSGEVLNIMLN